jgi:hypothetical protein
MQSYQLKHGTQQFLPPIVKGQSKKCLNMPNLNKVLVLDKDDLERIYGHLTKTQSLEEAAIEEKKRKKDLQEKSLALTKNWTNTIEV